MYGRPHICGSRSNCDVPVVPLLCPVTHRKEVVVAGVYLMVGGRLMWRSRATPQEAVFPDPRPPRPLPRLTCHISTGILVMPAVGTVDQRITGFHASYVFTNYDDWLTELQI